jgi:hypothetical protein
MRRVVRALAPIVAATVLAACNALIGVRDIFLDEDGAVASGNGDSSLPGTDGSSPPSDGGTDGSNRPSDGGADAACVNVDLTSDTKNCGACAHDCLGGACTGGKCNAVAVVATTGQPFALAVDGNNLYFSDVVGPNGTVNKIDKLAVNGTATSIATTTDPLIYYMQIDSTGIYVTSGSVSYSNGKGVVETFHPDGSGKRTIAATDIPAGLVIDSANTYFADLKGSPQAIHVAPKVGGDGGAPVLSTPEPQAELLAIDGLRLFWTQDRNTTGSIRRCTLPACLDKVDLSTNVDAPGMIAAAGGNVYYGTFDTIYRVGEGASAGTSGTPIAKNQAQPAWIAVDDKDIYWLNTGTLAQQFANGSVRRCPIVGGVPACVGDGDVVATSAKNPRMIVMDPVAVYWTVQYEGTVYRLAR